MRPNSLFLFGTLLALSVSLEAAEWASKEAGVSFQLPSDPDWEQIKADPGAGEQKLIFQRRDKMAVVWFSYFANKASADTLDGAYVQRWEESHYRGREIKKLSGGFITLNGRCAYQVCDRANREGEKREFVTILWLGEDNRLCSISATRYEGDPLHDPVIEAFIGSLNFLPRASK